MSNRCPDCNKFVGLEVQDPEVQSLEVDDDTGGVTAEVRLSVACAECGSEMKETTFEFSGIPEGLPEHIAEHGNNGSNYTLTAEENSVEGGDRYQSVLNGRPVPFRFQKKFYTAQLSVDVFCSCGNDFNIEFNDEVQASGMEDMN